MAREKVDNKLNVVIGTKAQVEADTTIPDNSIIIVTDEELTPNDIPELPQSKITNLVTDLGNKVNKNADIVAGTKTKITYDAKGLVTGGSDLVESDIPPLAISKITGLQTDLGNKLDASKSAVATVGGLVSPTTVLSSNELVGVGTNGEQVRIQLGEGLTLEGSTSPYTLKASGGGGGETKGGFKLSGDLPSCSRTGSIFAYLSNGNMVDLSEYKYPSQIREIENVVAIIAKGDGVLRYYVTFTEGVYIDTQGASFKTSSFTSNRDNYYIVLESDATFLVEDD